MRPAPNADSARARAAQTSAPSCETPPVSRKDRRARRAGVDGKGADHAGQQIGRAQADEVAVDVGAAGRVGDEAARRRRRLHHDDDGDDQRQRRDLREIVEPGAGKREFRRRARHRAERGDAAQLQPQRDDERGGEPQPDQRAGKARIDAFARQHDREHAKADAERGQIGRAEACGERGDLRDQSPPRRLEAEQRRRLADEDVTGDSREESRGDRDRQQVGDEAETKDAGSHERQADAEREHRRVGGVMRRAARSPAAPALRRRSARSSNRRRPTAGGWRRTRRSRPPRRPARESRSRPEIPPDAPSPSARVWRSRRASRPRPRRRRDR